MSNGKGSSKRRAAEGGVRRKAGTGEPVDQLPAAAEAMIPRAITRGMPPALVAQLFSEAQQIWMTYKSVEERRLALVIELREQGMSWQSVGWFIGISGQGARQMYARVIEDQVDDVADGWGEGEDE